MMNKIRSAKVHLVKFLFVLPLATVALLAFRSSHPGTKEKPVIHYSSIVIDLETKDPLAGVKIVNTNTGKQTTTDERGYFTLDLPADNPIHVEMIISKPGYRYLVTNSFSLEKKGNTVPIGLMEVIAIRKGKTSDKCIGCNSSISMREGNQADFGYAEVRKYYEKLLSGWPAFIDTMPADKKIQEIEVNASHSIHKNDNLNEEQQEFFLRNPNINLLHWKDNGDIEIYFKDLQLKTIQAGTELEKFEIKHGKLPRRPGSVRTKNNTIEEKKFADRNAVKAMTLMADTIIWTVNDRTLYFKGRAMLDVAGSEMFVNANLFEFSSMPLVYIDGKEADLTKDYIAEKGARYKIVSLDKTEGQKRYGEKGKKGVIEITTQPFPKTNFISPPGQMDGDIKRYGIKPDNC